MRYIGGIKTVTSASCLKQNKAAPMPRAQGGRGPQAGWGGIGVFPVSGCSAKPRCPSGAFLNTQDALKPGHHPSSIVHVTLQPHTCTRSTHGPARCPPAAGAEPLQDMTLPGPAQPRLGVQVLLAPAWTFLFSKAVSRSSFPAAAGWARPRVRRSAAVSDENAV